MKLVFQVIKVINYTLHVRNLQNSLKIQEEIQYCLKSFCLYIIIQMNHFSVDGLLVVLCDLVFGLSIKQTVTPKRTVKRKTINDAIYNLPAETCLWSCKTENM